MFKEEDGYFGELFVQKLTVWQTVKTNKEDTHEVWAKLLLILVGEQLEYSEDVVSNYIKASG